MDQHRLPCGRPPTPKGEMNMLSTKNYSIEDLPVSVQALTEEEANMVNGGNVGLLVGLVIFAGTHYKDLFKLGEYIGDQWYEALH
jgi:hypothetical protein